MDTALQEMDFLVKSNHRVGVLEELTGGARERSELRAGTGASTPTMSRILTDFEERRWIVRDRPTYELTPLGEFVAERFFGLREAMEVERTLRDVWQWLPREMEEISVELFADAVISYAGPGYPYEPVERLTQLTERTTRMRGFDSIVFKSINNEAVCRAVLDGKLSERSDGSGPTGAVRRERSRGVQQHRQHRHRDEVIRHVRRS